MKKKIVSLCAVAALALTAIAGSTIAYFTDKDAADNVFTYGDVKIDLVEKFEQNAKLLPVVYTEDGMENTIEKTVDVANEGSEAAFVRVHIAIPSIADDGDDTWNAAENLVHFNYAPESLENWEWAASEGGKGYNYYETTIAGVDYNVYVVTYKTALAAGETTATSAMNRVYLDAQATNDDIAKLQSTVGEFQIKVVAEAAQTAGFGGAFEALNTAFGVPGTYPAFN